MLGINAPKPLVKGEFAKAVRKAVHDSMVAKENWQEPAAKGPWKVKFIVRQLSIALYRYHRIHIKVSIYGGLPQISKNSQILSLQLSGFIEFFIGEMAEEKVCEMKKCPNSLYI